MMKRRTFLQTGTAALVASFGMLLPKVSPKTWSAAAAAKNTLDGAVYVPGYVPKFAFFEGQPALKNRHLSRTVPKDYNGTVTLLTRLALNGEITQALFPVKGHDVCISADGKAGYFGTLEQDSYVVFDPKSLDLIAVGKPVAEDWVGGGHGTFLDAGSVLAISERAPKVGYLGLPEKHFGRVTLREPETLKVLESYSTFGISPHDIRLLADGRHLAIANYGSTYPVGGTEYGVPRHVVEPSVTIIDTENGKLVEKYVSDMQDKELRHLCAHDFETIFAIQTELGAPGLYHDYFKDKKVTYEGDLTAGSDASYLSAPTLRLNTATGKLVATGSAQMQELMRHGLSIHYDPTHHEVIATYPSAQVIMIFDANTGEVKRHVDCLSIGLRFPCGVVLLPDDKHYAISGYWESLYIFERGTHRLVRELCHYTTFFGHSHITAA